MHIPAPARPLPDRRPLPADADADQQARFARQRRRDWLAFASITMGSFIALLDVQIVASSLNELQAGLSASADEIQWVQSAYLIAEIIAIPLSGYLSRMLSTRVFYTICALGFTAASLACAFAWSLGSIAAFRVLQGLLGGGLIPASFACMFLLFPDQASRNLPQLLGGMTTMLAAALGPTFGGWVTQALSWQWLFLINLAPGLACAGIVWLTLDVDRPRPEMWKQIDLPGALFLAMFLGGMEYALDTGPRHDWFADDVVAFCAAISVSGALLFLWRMVHVEHPIIDLRVFRNRNFSTASLIASATGVVIFTLAFITPVFLGTVRGYNPLQIGHVMMIQGAAMVFSAPFVAVLLRRTDPRISIVIGLCMSAAGLYGNSLLNADWGVWEFLVPQALRGAGTIFTMVPMTNLALGTLPVRQINDGSALYTVTRNLGGAIGLAVVTTLLNQRNWTHWQAMAERARGSHHPLQESVARLTQAFHGTLGPDAQAGAFAALAREMQRQATTMSFADMYLLLAVVTAASLLLVPLIARPQGAADIAAH